MSNLRQHLDAGRRQYEAAQYPGDLAADLLGESLAPPRGRSIRWAWAIPLSAAALAAMVAVIVWMHHPAKDSNPQLVHIDPVPVLPSPQTKPIALAKTDWRAVGQSLVNLRLGTEGTDELKEAVAHFASGVDRVLDAPLINDTVATSRKVADDLQVVAFATWAQLMPRN